MSAPAYPNILLILVDQLRYPQPTPSNTGFYPDLSQILTFLGTTEGNSYAVHFPGFTKLREYAVAFTDHTIAESACIPSRASIMTGQYGPRTGVTQTDGLFKSGDATNFPWLRPNGTPTMGHWFRQLGYTTHYFGKWHVSDPPSHSLETFGFADWEMSWPEPHGSLPNNMGVFRDYQFADLACSFLRNRGLGVPFARLTSQYAATAPTETAPKETRPFFAVCSFTNPHDIATYPTLPRLLLPSVVTDGERVYQPIQGPGDSVPVPLPNSESIPPRQGTFRIPLNPTAFPQDCAAASQSQPEQLYANNKPTSQYDNSIKVGLGLAAKAGLSQANRKFKGEDWPVIFQAAVQATLTQAIPFQTQSDPDGAALGFLQYYGYMIAMVDRHVNSVLTALEDSGLRESTLVVFAADHGEYGAAHGMMMEKWHTAYQEALSVPVVFSAPWLNSSTDSPIPFNAQTSHIDLLPTLLGMTQAPAEDLQAARATLSKTHQAAALPGADLSALINAETNPRGGIVNWPDGTPRQGVLFVTDDCITEPLPKDADPHNITSWQQYEVFLAAVDVLRNPSADGTPAKLPNLAPGPVCQPAHVRALRSGDWKLVRYCDPWSEQPVPDQWELYNLKADPSELHNLVAYTDVDTVMPNPPKGVTVDQITAALPALKQELQRQEAVLLSPYPSAHPTAR